MEVYCTGAKGYIGRELVKAGIKPLECDVTDYESVEKAVSDAKPELIVHLAGVSSPDDCEKEPEKSMKANVRGTYFLMDSCFNHKIPAILLSSDQIWGGGWPESLFNKHSETSRLTPAVNSYGMQKSAAEFMVSTFDGMKIIRTSTIFNKARLEAKLSALKNGTRIDAPTFIRRSYIHLNDFVYLLSEYCSRFESAPRVLHLAGSKTVSCYEFWLEAAKQFELDPKLVSKRTKEKNFLYAAKRPHFGGLDTSLSRKLGFRSFNYIDGIKRMKNE